ncbi:MAG: aromatic amino acid transport family protein [Campylobacterota bacterium]|nr:aromatic amino acid transport family protein [Campylobacterota bacterium]
MKRFQMLMLALLVTGNMIGAGILGMPITTGIAGLWPSLLIMLLFSFGMLFSALVLAKETNSIQKESFNLPSLYEKYLGTGGKWLGVIANLIILYGIMIGYLAGGTKIIVTILDLSGFYEPLILLALFLSFTALTLSGMSIIQKYNTVLMLSLWIAFFILVFMGASGVEIKRLHHVDWGYLPMAVPLIVASLCFHNIIPTICRESGWSQDIWKPIALGLLIGIVMNVIWIVVGIGVVPEFGHISLNQALHSGIPVTIEMSQILKSDAFALVGMVFAIIAITTSYVTSGIGLKDFSTDLFENSFGIHQQWLIMSVSFIPPLITAYFFADIFLEALNIASGIGVVLLFGVLPSIIFYQKATSFLEKSMAVFFFTVFAIALSITTLQTFGILHLHPNLMQ